MLLDEPFGALDSKVRKELRGEMRRIHDATGVTTILVTHDQEEAMALADRVVLMNKGRIEQIGAPAELDAAPASPFAFTFLGETNRLPCDVVGGIARFEGFGAPVICPARAADGPASALFRPEDTHLDAGPRAEGLPARVVEIRGRGLVRSITCQVLAGQRLVADVAEATAERFEIGQRVHLTIRRVVLDTGEAAPGAEIVKTGSPPVRLTA